MKQYAIIINVAVILAVILTILATENPLALLGLFFLQQIQFSDPESQYGAQELADAVGDDPEYNEHGTGFTAKL